MPIRYIKVPNPVTFVDPITKKTMTEPDGKPVVWTFEQLIQRLMSNPMWAENYEAMRAQQAISDAMDNIRDGYIELAEEDWNRLKLAAESPRTQVDTQNGPQVMIGLGMHPSVVRQILPLLSQIIQAPTSRG